MAVDKDVYRELGQIEERINTLEETMSRQCKKLDELLKIKQQLDGGKKVVLGLVAVAATCGAGVSWLSTHIKWD